MKKFLICAALATTATTLHAASMSYNAFITCGGCVTVFLSWADEPFPISFAEVDDSQGNPYFFLNVAFPSQTGSISPDPQTVSGLPSFEMNVISDGQVGVDVATIRPALNVFATLDLLDSNHKEVDSAFFVASVGVAAVPEPTVWSLTFAGMAVLFLWMKWRRRNSQT